MTAEERESLFEQMLGLPNELKSELLSNAFALMESLQETPNNLIAIECTERFFEHVAYVKDQYLEGKLDK